MRIKMNPRLKQRDFVSPAPTKPTQFRASVARSTSLARGMRLLHTCRMARRAATSGGGISSSRSKLNCAGTRGKGSEREGEEERKPTKINDAHISYTHEISTYQQLPPPFSHRPALRSAGSIALGRFVAPTTMTWCWCCCCCCSPSAPEPTSIPSISVNSCVTSRAVCESTCVCCCPRFGQMASSSSRNTTTGRPAWARARACANSARRAASASPTRPVRDSSLALVTRSSARHSRAMVRTKEVLSGKF